MELCSDLDPRNCVNGVCGTCMQMEVCKTKSRPLHCFQLPDSQEYKCIVRYYENGNRKYCSYTDSGGNGVVGFNGGGINITEYDKRETLDRLHDWWNPDIDGPYTGPDDDPNQLPDMPDRFMGSTFDYGGAPKRFIGGLAGQDGRP